MKPNSLSRKASDGSMVAGVPAVVTHRFEVKPLVEFGLYCGLLVRVIDRMDTWFLVERSERRFVVLSADVLPFRADGHGEAGREVSQ